MQKLHKIHFLYVVKGFVLRIFIFSLFFVGISQVSFGQDPEFSQFFANPLHVNPAFAGTTELPRAVVNYRNQWPRKGATFTTYSVSYDQISKKFNAGIGFQAYHDRELNNIINTSAASFSYSYHLKMNQWNFITMGLQAGLVLKQFNSDQLIFSSNINQLTGEINGATPNYSDEKKLYPDFSIGAVGQHDNFFWGLSAFHITRPNESILEGDQKGKIPVKYTLHAGFRTKKYHNGLLSREFTFSPNIMYQQQGTFKQVNLGIYFIERTLLFGAWFRNNVDTRPDALIALIGFAKEKFQFGYSFDYTFSELSDYSSGSHEISLTFFFGKLDGIPVTNKLLFPMI